MGDYTKEHPKKLDHALKLDGKTVVISGANSGIGFEAARIFAGAGARVVMGCRNAERAHEAVKRIRARNVKAVVGFIELDLASLASIRAFANQVSKGCERIDILCNNAGVFSFERGIYRTRDGFESHFGINHLGHFALTGLLFGKINASTPARIVTVSSMGRSESAAGIDFDDLQCARNYSSFRAYANSKLANLLFTYDLDRRLRARGFQVKAVACTPGLTKSNLAKTGADLTRSLGSWWKRLFYYWFVQSGAKGAQSEIYAAVGDDIDGGDYIGRSGFMASFGRLTKLELSTKACNPEAAKRLWEISEELTGVRFLDESIEYRNNSANI